MYFLIYGFLALIAINIEVKSSTIPTAAPPIGANCSICCAAYTAPLKSSARPAVIVPPSSIQTIGSKSVFAIPGVNKLPGPT